MKRLVIANRGEIARRILKAARTRGYQVAVISTPSDSDAVVRQEADAVLEVNSFLSIAAIVKASQNWNANFLHPGYGFLSENAEFSESVQNAGIAFVGPTPQNMRLLGPKEAAKSFAQSCNVPTLKSFGSKEFGANANQHWTTTLAQKNLHFPILVKASNGGGGRGLRVARAMDELATLIETSRSEALAGFGAGDVFLEQYLDEARHIEVQIFGDGLGRAIAVGDRECSVQRRYQKIIEEAPAPYIPKHVREQISACAIAIAQNSHYRGAGTVEFLLSPQNEFFFLEMNTRIQVEHSVTEKAWGIDLVQAQFELAEGKWPAQLDHNLLLPPGHAIEARIVSEDPLRDFAPTPGSLVRYREPTQTFVRVDSSVVEGSRVNPEFDSLIAKVIASGINREEARKRLLQALESMVLHGCTTNLAFVISTLNHHDYISGQIHTKWVEQNISCLNKSLLPRSLRSLFTAESFIEQLVLALCGGLSCHDGAFAQKFANLSNSYLRIGSTFEEKKLILTCLDAQNGKFAISGELLHRAICDAAPEMYAHCEAIRALHAQSLCDAKSLKLEFVATRVEQTRVAITCLGETLLVESKRHQALVSNNATVRKAEVSAPLAGKITSVCVSENDKVAAGQILFVLESMKMQFDIRADHDAVIESVLAFPGQVLTGPSILATLKSQESPFGG